ncbi:HYD1 signature containing ADP-ribosyltransferase family protein [Thermopolyspora flexuosa]|uniref:HYD1 signature containing ADP-ribosyltransferase family protein n=1 Tax=Thermopolyspora flexuosa TaxID=103836 RepID=UPI00357116D9
MRKSHHAYELGAGRISVSQRPSNGNGSRILWHYTREENLASILKTRELRPSLRSRWSRDARYGDGQYLTDIPPGTMPGSRLAFYLVRRPEEAWRFTHYLGLDVTGLVVVRCRRHVYRIPGHEPLDLKGRIVMWGVNRSRVVPQGSVEP